MHKRAVRAVLGWITARPRARGLLRALTRRGLLPRGVWRHLPVHEVFAVELPNGETFQYASRGRDAIGWALYWRGLRATEHETVRPFVQLARRSGLVVDVGAHTGLYTLLACASNPECRVVAFEPVPRIFQRLVANIELNDWTQRCEARAEAVADVVGVASLHVPFGEVPSSASLRPGGYAGVKGQAIEAPVTTLDAALPQGSRVGLVKIDVETTEARVLEGMRGVLSQWAPSVVLECLADGPARDIERVLSPFGYRYYHLRKHGPAPVDSIDPDPRGLYRNFLCTVDDPLAGATQ